MTLIIQKPTGAKLVMAQTYVGTDDPDAAVYVAAVEAADGEALETATKVAIHSFVKGCKNDGIWPAIKASCILAGARTLAGALVPLVGTAPTNVGGLFVSGDYNRKTGLVGDGSTKYLDTNRNNNADPQNSKHISLWVSTIATTSPIPAYVGGAGVSGSTQILDSAGLLYRVNSSSGETAGAAFATGFTGISRASSASSTNRSSGATRVSNVSSAAPTDEALLLYIRNNLLGVSYANARIAFYSIGESLDLALLDARVTDLINAIGASIP
jgi:hypothetical protein